MISSLDNREPSGENSFLWSSFRLSFFLTVLGGFLMMLVARLSNPHHEVSAQAVDSVLVRQSLPIVSLVIVVTILSTLTIQPTSASLQISGQTLRTWGLLVTVIASAGLMPQGLAAIQRAQLALAMTLYAVISITYHLKIVQISMLFARKQLVLGLVLPGIIVSLREYEENTSPFLEVTYQATGIAITTAILMALTRKRGSLINFSESDVSATFSAILSLFCFALLVAATTIPLRMSLLDKMEFLSIVPSTRLPLFAVTTFLLCAAPVILVPHVDIFRRMVAHRRLGFLSTLLSLISLMGLLAFLPISNDNSRLLFPTLVVACVSSIAAPLLPWIIVRIREARVDRTEIASLLFFSVAIFFSRGDVFAWQSGSLLALLALFGILFVRHLRYVQPAIVRNQVAERKAEDQGTTDLVSVVVPSFNPGPEVLRTVSRIRAAFDASGSRAEIIVVSDGSTDESVALLEEDPNVDRHIWLRSNHGKGGALREGFAHCTGHVMCFVDADGDIDPSSLVSMIERLKDADLDIVYGSKIHHDSSIEMTTLRRVISELFRVFVRLLFRFDISDTQTGIKVYRSTVARKALPLLAESGFTIDLELFVVAHSLGYTKFEDYPILLNRRGGSTVGFTTVLDMFFSTLRLFRRRTLTLDYCQSSES